MAGVGIVDYGVSNLLNVIRAFEHCGVHVALIDRADKAKACDRIVLPGVGAFGDAMAALGELGFVDALKDFVKTGRPLMGICAGMQLLLEQGDEFGAHKGFGFIEGKVVHIPTDGEHGQVRKVPHVGWNEMVLPESRNDWAGTLLDGWDEKRAVYFVHSYMALPTNDSDRLADCVYDGVRFCASVMRNNVLGMQAHPEKSGEAGLEILRRFCKS